MAFNKEKGMKFLQNTFIEKRNIEPQEPEKKEIPKLVEEKPVEIKRITQHIEKPKEPEKKEEKVNELKAVEEVKPKVEVKKKETVEKKITIEEIVEKKHIKAKVNQKFADEVKIYCMRNKVKCLDNLIYDILKSSLSKKNTTLINEKYKEMTKSKPLMKREGRGRVGSNLFGDEERKYPLHTIVENDLYMNIKENCIVTGLTLEEYVFLATKIYIEEK